jgi:hypothetical protein
LTAIRKNPGTVEKLLWNLPWLFRYPLSRARAIGQSIVGNAGKHHLIFVVANHFEPAYNEEPNGKGGYGVPMDVDSQLRRFDQWARDAYAIGNAVRDCDGMPFRHTNFYPAEQYHRKILDRMAQLQADGLGEVEIHLHHGVSAPDNKENLRRSLVEFRDLLAHEHKCLSREGEHGSPRYAFIHGNWALANSAQGRFCGVDSEMEILAETGCYADMTLPSAPDVSQVPRINSIYQCGRPLSERKPHRSGRNLAVGGSLTLPIIFTGPLLLDWRRNTGVVPQLRVETGDITRKAPLDMQRFNLWRSARIGVSGRPDWIFVKLFCHGFFDGDQPSLVGDRMREFWMRVFELSQQTAEFQVHFATAREAFNMAYAAVDGHAGNPGEYRDYKLTPIMARHP